jgi:hypothetical protein
LLESQAFDLTQSERDFLSEMATALAVLIEDAFPRLSVLTVDLELALPDHKPAAATTPAELSAA